MHNLHVLPLFFSCIVAAPAPQIGVSLPLCLDTYTVTKQRKFEGDPKTGDYTVGGGDTLTAGSSFSTSVSVDVGTGISVSEIAGLDLSESVSKTTTKTVSQDASGPCPVGPWKCALAIYPQLLEVSGAKVPAPRSECTAGGNPYPPAPYVVTYPIEGDSGGVRSRVEVCACKNFEHWADNGAPSIVCDNCA